MGGEHFKIVPFTAKSFYSTKVGGFNITTSSCPM
jgi:hypothetical protein